jgi:hypothetical protein
MKRGQSSSPDLIRRSRSGDIGGPLIINALVLLIIYLTGEVTPKCSAMNVPVSFPLDVMAPPLKSSCCRLFSVVDSATGGPQCNVGQVRANRATNSNKVFFQVGLVGEMRTQWSLLHVLNQSLLQKRKHVSQSTGVSKGGGGVSFNMACSLPLTH